MACACKGSGSRWQVVVGGKAVFVTSSEATARAVSRRYPNSTVVDSKA